MRGHATFRHIEKHNGVGTEWIHELAQLLQAEADRYPILLEAVRSGAFGENLSGTFEFGLDCVMEGINARVNRSRK